jgi:hypothetical protein
MPVIGAVFGAVLLGLSAVTGLLGLTAGFVGMRMAGQGALGLAATTAAALWFTRRRGLAVGVVGAAGFRRHLPGAGAARAADRRD